MTSAAQDCATTLMICGACNKVFIKEKNLTEHLKVHVEAAFRSVNTQRQSVRASDESSEHCPVRNLCPLVCSVKVEIIPASFTTHDQRSGQQSIPESIILQRENLAQNENVTKLLLSKATSRFPSRRAFECRICSRQYRFRQAAYDHANSHLSKKPYKCRYCNTNLSSLRARRCHEQKMHSKNCDQRKVRSLMPEMMDSAEITDDASEKASDIDDEMYDSSDESSDAASNFQQTMSPLALTTTGSHGLQLPTKTEEHSSAQANASKRSTSKELGELTSPMRKANSNGTGSRSRIQKSQPVSSAINSRMSGIRHSCSQCPLQFTDAALLVKHMMFHRQFAQNNSQSRNRSATASGAGMMANSKQPSAARPGLAPPLPPLQTAAAAAASGGRVPIPPLSALGHLAGTIPTSLARASVAMSSSTMTSTPTSMVPMSSGHVSLHGIPTSSVSTQSPAAAVQGFYMQRPASLTPIAQQQQQQQLSQAHQQQTRFYRPIFTPVLPPQFGHYSTMPPVGAAYFPQGSPFYLHTRPRMPTLQQLPQLKIQPTTEDQQKQLQQQEVKELKEKHIIQKELEKPQVCTKTSEPEKLNANETAENKGLAVVEAAS